MKHLLAIVLLLSSFVANAQRSEQKAPSMWPYAAGAALTTSGALLTFQPEMKQVAIDIKNYAQSDSHHRLTFDNYLQFAPVLAAPALSACGLNSVHTLPKMIALEGASVLLGFTFVQATKEAFHIKRPSGVGINSFPSGHTYIAFVGAETLRKEYGEEYPWLAVAGYAVATLVGTMRIYNDRHWAGDVLAGAGLGILSVNITYWISR